MNFFKWYLLLKIYLKRNLTRNYLANYIKKELDKFSINSLLLCLLRKIKWLPEKREAFFFNFGDCKISRKNLVMDNLQNLQNIHVILICDVHEILYSSRLRTFYIIWRNWKLSTTESIVSCTWIYGNPSFV